MLFISTRQFMSFVKIERSCAKLKNIFVGGVFQALLDSREQKNHRKASLSCGAICELLRQSSNNRHRGGGNLRQLRSAVFSMEKLPILIVDILA
jgi:hypothetical protein